MKGIVFGIWYFIQSVFILLSAIISYIFFAHFDVLLDSPQLNCAFIYYMVNIIIGVGCLIIFTVASRRYKYRKRDDISMYTNMQKIITLTDNVQVIPLIV